MTTTTTFDPNTLEFVLTKIVYTPTTGQTVTLAQAQRQYALIKPVTVNMPASPNDGDVVKLGCTQVVTTLTHSGNGNTLNSSLSTIALGGFGEWIYDASTTSWYRFG